MVIKIRPIWKGAISFGLVYVPVKLYAATEQKDVKFNYLHEKCKSPVQYRRFCPHCQVEVPMEEIVRGYEYEKGKYVIIDEGDFEKLAGANSGRSIEIMDFVNLEEIDPVYYEKAYYLAPGDGGAKVYELFRRAMVDTGKVAVARVIIRNKQALAAIRESKNILMMCTMHYPDEIRPAGALPELSYRVDLHDNEVKMAVNLINSLSAEFQPEKYNDTYRQALMDVIQARIAGEAVAVPEKAEAGKVVDLMEALKASIELAREERDKKENAPAKARTGRTAVKRKTS